MKYKKIEHSSVFKPFDITITFESQRERDLWYRFVGNLSANDVAEIANKNDEWYKGLQKSFTPNEGNKVTSLHDILSVKK